MSDDYAELLRRRALTEDAARPDAVERRHAANGRTARENIADLVDAGSFVEYGRFAIAGQRMRRNTDDLINRTRPTVWWPVPLASTAAPAPCWPMTTPCAMNQRRRPRPRFVDTW